MTGPQQPAPVTVTVTPLADLLTADPRKPPWSWSNLTEDQARQLDASLGQWVQDYNATMATKPPQVVPRCWRQHPALVQLLPVLYWAWWASHADPAAGLGDALDFHLRHLLIFQDHLPELLEARGSNDCRAEHVPRAATDAGRLFQQDIDTAAGPDDGPDSIDVLINTTFGT